MFNLKLAFWAETCSENNTINCDVLPEFIIILIIRKHNRDENVLKVFRKLLHVLKDSIFLTITHLRKEMKQRKKVSSLSKFPQTQFSWQKI